MATNSGWSRLVPSGSSAVAMGDDEIRSFKKCSVKGCERKIHACKLCRAHYQRRLFNYELDETTPIKLGNTYGRISKHLAATKSPTTRDLEWAAGFLEGEGCFLYTGSTHVVDAGQNQRECLDRLQNLFGGAVRKEREGFHRWKLSGARARGVMMTLYVLLSTRRQEQIKGALSGK